MDRIFPDHIWIIMILISLIYWAFVTTEVRPYANAHPDKKRSYSRLLKGYLFGLLLPWVVMGIGRMIGRVPVSEYTLKAYRENPYVFAFFTAIALIWIAGSYWIFFRGGARTLSEHPGIVGIYLRDGWFSFRSKYVEATSPVAVKLFWILFLAGSGYAIFTTSYLI